MEPSTNDSSNPPLHEALRERVQRGDVEGLIDAVLGEVQLDAEDQNRVRMYGLQKAAGLLELAETMTEPDDEEDLYESLVNAWIELRAEWSRYNKTSAYRTIVFDEDVSATSAYAALSSGILRRIEPLVVRDLHRLIQFAAAPQPLLAQSGRLAESLVGEVASTDQWQHRLNVFLMQSVDSLRAALDRPEALSEAVDAFLQQAEQHVRSLEARSTPPASVVSVALEELVLRASRVRSRHLSPSIRLPDEDLTLVQVRRLMGALSGVTEELVGLLPADTEEVIPLWIRVEPGAENFRVSVPRETMLDAPLRLKNSSANHRSDPDDQHVEYACSVPEEKETA